MKQSGNGSQGAIKRVINDLSSDDEGKDEQLLRRSVSSGDIPSVDENDENGFKQVPVYVPPLVSKKTIVPRLPIGNINMKKNGKAFSVL